MSRRGNNNSARPDSRPSAPSRGGAKPTTSGSVRPDNRPTPSREGTKPSTTPAMGSWAAKLVAPKPAPRPSNAPAHVFIPNPAPKPVAYTSRPPPKPSAPVSTPAPSIAPTPPPTPVIDLPWPETDDFNTPLVAPYQPPQKLTREEIIILGDKVIEAIVKEYQIVQEWNASVLNHAPAPKTFIAFDPSLPQDYKLCAYVAQMVKSRHDIDIVWKYGQTSITIILDPVGVVSLLPHTVVI